MTGLALALLLGAAPSPTWPGAYGFVGGGRKFQVLVATGEHELAVWVQSSGKGASQRLLAKATPRADELPILLERQLTPTSGGRRAAGDLLATLSFRGEVPTLSFAALAPGHAPLQGVRMRWDSPVRPGRGIGPFDVGDPAAKLRLAGFQPHLEPGWMQRDAMYAHMDDDEVFSLSVPMPSAACVEIEGTRCPGPETADMLAQRLGTCAPGQGTEVVCEGVRIQPHAANANPPATIEVRAVPRPTGRCQKPLDQRTGTISIVPDRTYCLGGKSFTKDATPSSISKLFGPCSSDLLFGGSHLQCGATTFSFAGPHAEFVRITRN